LETEQNSVELPLRDKDYAHQSVRLSFPADAAPRLSLPVILELVFPAVGTFLPTDHAYPLYGALSGIVPQFHDEASPLRFAPITGRATPDGHLHLTEHSSLRVRLSDDSVPLAGKRLTVFEFDN